MNSTSFVAFLSLSVAAFCSLSYLQIAFTSVTCASHLNINIKVPRILDNTMVMADKSEMVDTLDVIRTRLRQKRAREEKAKAEASSKRIQKFRKRRRRQHAKHASDKKGKSALKEEGGNDVGSNTKKIEEDEVKEEVTKNEEEQGGGEKVRVILIPDGNVL